MPPVFFVIIAIVVISTVVGVVAKLLNNLNETNAVRARQAAQAQPRAGAGAGGGGAVVRQSGSDMDRFLAEIDRLRKKAAEAPPQPSNQTPAAPVVQPAKTPDRPRPRVMAELAEQPRPDNGFPQAAPSPIAPPTGPKAGDLPVATVVAPSSATGAPATRVTRLVGRPRPLAKTPFAKNLTTLLNSGHGLGLAIVLSEILGPPKCKKA